MAISLNYRGDVKSKEPNATVQWLKNNKKSTFVEWCSTGFTVGLNERSPTLVPEDDMGAAVRNVTMIGDNTGASRVFTDWVAKKYDSMYLQEHLCIGMLVNGRRGICRSKITFRILRKR